MAEVSALTAAERALVEALDRRGVRFMLVGLSAALLQGANVSTQDIDLWFEELGDPRIGEAVREVGGIWVSGSFGMRPPGIAGDVLGDRLDVVTHMHGLETFDVEYAGALSIEIDGLMVKVLPLARIVASKRATGRPKDQAQVPALEEALAVIEGGADPE